MKLTSAGGGVGISLSRIRERGAPIKGNGQSEGVVPWAKMYDSTIIATNQGSVRRGAASVNLDINHPDIGEYLQIRRPKRSQTCLLYTSPSPRDRQKSRMPSSA